MIRNNKAIEQVKCLREKGLSFRNIAKIMEKDLKTIYRWSNYETPLTTPRKAVSRK